MCSQQDLPSVTYIDILNLTFFRSTFYEKKKSIKYLQGTHCI